MQFIEKRSGVLLLLLIPLGVYAKSLFYGFSPMDEQWMIVHDTGFLEKWKNIFTVFNEPTAEIFYRPMFMVSLIVDYHLGGASSFIYHLSNLVLHLACVYLLFRFLLQLNTERKTAWLLSLLFAVHPALLHAVAWVPGRNDVLLGLFALLAAIHLVKYLNTGKNSFFILHLFFFVIALFVKETGVVLPFVFLALYLASDGGKKKLWVPLGCWLLITGAWLLLHSLMVPTRLSSGKDVASSLGNFLLSLLVSFGKLIFPVRQSVLPTLAREWLWPGFVALGLLVIAAFGFGFRNKKLAAVGAFMCVVLLALPAWYGATKGLGEHYEHRLYAPAIGLLIFVSQIKFNIQSKISQYAFLLVACLFCLKAFLRMEVYSAEETYLDAGIQEAPQYYLFHFKKGNLLLARGENQSAIEAYSKALELSTSKPEIYNNRANAYVATGKKEEAIRDYSEALKKSGDDPRVLLQRCRAYSRFDDLENALKDLTVLEQCCMYLVDPEFSNRLKKRWRLKVIEELSAQIANDPRNGLLYVNRAKYYLDNRMGHEALADLKTATDLEPHNKDFKRYYEELASSFKP